MERHSGKNWVLPAFQGGRQLAIKLQLTRTEMLREIAGEIVFPKNCPVKEGCSAFIEVQDVSLADAPSVKIACIRLLDVSTAPLGHLPFSLTAPEVPEMRSLAISVHVSMTESDRINSGDLLTTERHSVPSQGPARQMIIRVTLI
uniref:hypothetical protein n=1 Tax=Candidatus Electronema sp. TaxID=2698783 RepID=UPI0040572A21